MFFLNLHKSAELFNVHNRIYQLIDKAEEREVMNLESCF